MQYSKYDDEILEIVKFYVISKIYFKKPSTFSSFLKNKMSILVEIYPLKLI